MINSQKKIGLILIGIFILTLLNSTYALGQSEFPTKLELNVKEGSIYGYKITTADYKIFMQRYDPYPTATTNESDSELNQMNVLAEFEKVQYVSNGTIIYVKTFVAKTPIPMYDFSDEVFYENWLAHQYMSYKYEPNELNLLQGLMNVMLPSNVPLTTFYTAERIDKYAELQLFGIPYTKSYMDLPSYFREVVSLNVTSNSEVTIVNEQKLTSTTTIRFNSSRYQSFDLWTLNGTVVADRVFELFDNGVIKNRIETFNVSYSNGHGTYREVMNGTMTFALESNYVKLPPTNYFQEYLYLWIILILGGFLGILFITLRSQCKYEPERPNWTCPKPKKGQKQSKNIY